MKKTLVIISLMAAAFCSQAQVKIGGTPGSADANALLQLGNNSGSTKGLLMPRVALTSTSSTAPMTGTVPAGMVVYNTATTGDVTPGLYINTGSQWVSLSAAGAVVNFSTADPNAAGTNFTPGSPANGNAIYMSDVDNSLWSWNGTAYVSHTATKEQIGLSNVTNDAQEKLSNKTNDASFVNANDNTYATTSAVKNFVLSSLKGVYIGAWDASTNTPTLPAASAGNRNNFYLVAASGNVGGTLYNVGDMVISNGSTWDRIGTANTWLTTQVFDNSAYANIGTVGGATQATINGAVNTAMGTKAPLASPTFTGAPAAPTATAGTNTTQLATTAFVTTAVSNANVAAKADKVSGATQITDPNAYANIGTAANATQQAINSAINTQLALPIAPTAGWNAGTDGTYVILGKTTNGKEVRRYYVYRTLPTNTAYQVIVNISQVINYKFWTNMPTAHINDDCADISIYTNSNFVFYQRGNNGSSAGAANLPSAITSFDVWCSDGNMNGKTYWGYADVVMQ